jgi:hypothetical protein
MVERMAAFYGWHARNPVLHNPFKEKLTHYVTPCYAIDRF